MAPITWFEVGQVAKELGGTAVEVLAQEMYLAVANSGLNIAAWGGEDSQILRLARIYIAAHHATLAKRKGQAGQVVSQSAGGISQSYAQPQMLTSASLATTSYGQLYLALAKTRSFRAGMVTGTTGGGFDGGSAL